MATLPEQRELVRIFQWNWCAATHDINAAAPAKDTAASTTNGPRTLSPSETQRMMREMEVKPKHPMFTGACKHVVQSGGRNLFIFGHNN